MKRYTVSETREQFADVLNEADRGGGVIVERGEAQYVITPRRKSRVRAPSPMFEILEPAVADGQWTWTLTPEGL
jgi:antitoxin (DNA-binding transcriptional repressor) of toxin-antitoxin stability system